MAINLASKASAKVLERFKHASVIDGLFTSEYDWTGVHTVRVYSVNTLPLVDYDKTLVNGASRFGDLTEVADTYQEMSVNQDKAFNGSIDKGNNTQQLQIKAAGKVLKRQTDEVLIPYVDKYCLKQLAKGAGIMKIESNALTKSNIVEAIFDANADMNNRLVTPGGRVLYIGETLYTKLKLADQVMQKIESVAEKALVNGVVGKISDMQVRPVPDSYLPAGVQFMVVKKNTGCNPKKVETMRILNNQYIVDGAIVQGRLLHDCFVLGGRADGIYVYTNNASAVPTLVVNATAGTCAVTATNVTKCYYTLDGSDPKTSSERKELTIANNAGTISNVPAGATVRAYTTTTNKLDSGVAVAVSE